MKGNGLGHGHTNRQWDIATGRKGQEQGQEQEHGHTNRQWDIATGRKGQEQGQEQEHGQDRDRGTDGQGQDRDMT